MNTIIVFLFGSYAAIGLLAGGSHAFNVGMYSYPSHTYRKAAALVVFWPYLLARFAIEGLDEYRSESHDRRLDRMQKESRRLDREIRRLEGE